MVGGYPRGYTKDSLYYEDGKFLNSGCIAGRAQQLKQQLLRYSHAFGQVVRDDQLMFTRLMMHQPHLITLNQYHESDGIYFKDDETKLPMTISSLQQVIFTTSFKHCNVYDYALNTQYDFFVKSSPSGSMKKKSTTKRDLHLCMDQNQHNDRESLTCRYQRFFNYKEEEEEENDDDDDDEESNEWEEEYMFYEEKVESVETLSSDATEWISENPLSIGLLHSNNKGSNGVYFAIHQLLYMIRDQRRD